MSHETPPQSNDEHPKTMGPTRNMGNLEKENMQHQGNDIPSTPLFLEKSFESLSSLNEADLLKKARAKAYDRFMEIGFPSRSNDAFQYVRFLDQILNAPHEMSCLLATEGDKTFIESKKLPECLNSHLVFLNGYFRPDLSSLSALQGITIQPLAQAARSFNALLSASWNRGIKDEIDPLSLLSYTLSQDGLFLYVPPNKAIEAPIQVSYIYSDIESPSWTMPRLQVLLGHHAEVTLIETVDILNSSENLLYVNTQANFELEEGSSIKHASTLFDEKNTKAIHTHALRAYLKANARMISTSYTAPYIASRQSSRIWLKGENANAIINGSWMLSKEQEAHTHVHIQHDEPNCQSMQLFKGVVQDKSRSSFEGKIYVHKKAQKTQAYQLNNNLVLGPEAQAFSKPNLEIFADDVKASHGATSGQLDRDSLFYLQTRGLPKHVAESCLIEGFLSEVASTIQVKSLHEFVAKKIHGFCI